jgi:thymidylate synthase (FAD)
MKVKLKHYTPLTITDQAISKCWDKECDVNNPNTEKIDRVANKFKHKSTIEHLVYNFEIKGISRACLQELARHRIASLSVKSTRYTLKELKQETEFNDFGNKLDYERASKYVVWTGHHSVDITIFFMLEDLRNLIQEGISNDIAKYALPEAYKTELMWTINARSLQNFLSLRSDKSALWEIRKLAWEVYNAIPEDHQFLYNDSMKRYEKKIYERKVK